MIFATDMYEAQHLLDAKVLLIMFYDQCIYFRFFSFDSHHSCLGLCCIVTESMDEFTATCTGTGVRDGC